jgi:uncharacterized protein YndB with AHSA1/START domain
MDRVIQVSRKLRCNPSVAFKMFTENRLLEKWLTTLAEVEPRVEGKYELFWNPNDRENDSTIGCKVLALTQNRMIAFEWKGPKQLKELNEERPLTNVVVTFFPEEGGGTLVCLIHSGWRSSERWNLAYDFFVRNWKSAFDRLEQVANDST